jgi:tetratricopeptide (TPR) repeat protein
LFPNGRRFALSDQPGYGVSCGATGVFVGAVPLLQPCRNCGNFQKWRARPLDEINRELSMCYGVPVDFGAKVERLAAIARALDRGDLLHAHIATLHLQIPDPPLLAKGPQSAAELVTLAKDLHASGMLERDWDPSPVVTGRGEAMKEPTTPEETLALSKLRRTDPQAYLKVVNEWIRENPKNDNAYFGRHFAWMDLGEPHRALDDMNKVIELAPEPVAFIMRGEIYRLLGEYEKAVVDYARAEALDPEEWQDNGFCLLYQADAHAHLGNEAAPLACCARLRDDFWTPGMNNTPSGGKAEIAEKLCQIAADARRRRL